LYNPKRDGIDHPGHSTGGGNRSHVERLDSGFKNAPKRQDKINGETPMNISAAFPLFLKHMQKDTVLATRPNSGTLLRKFVFRLAKTVCL
jgi:hypothetical protein